MKYVVIGSSAAGVNAIRELRRLDKECQIVLISKDKDIDRPDLQGQGHLLPLHSSRVSGRKENDRETAFR